MSWLDFFKAPEPEPQRGFTISSPAGQDSGVTISTGATKEQPLDYTKGYNIYRDSPDPYKSSSIVTRDARRNIALGALPNIRASTDTVVNQDPILTGYFTRNVPAGQTMGNLPEKEGYVVNPLGRYMPPSEQVRQQKILQSTYAPRPTYDLLSVIGEGEKRPIQYSDAYFKSGSTRADSKFDPNYFLNSVLGTDLPVDPVPKGDVIKPRKDATQKAIDLYQTGKGDAVKNFNTLNNYLVQKGYNPERIGFLNDEM